MAPTKKVEKRRMMKAFILLGLTSLILVGATEKEGTGLQDNSLSIKAERLGEELKEFTQKQWSVELAELFVPEKTASLQKQRVRQARQLEQEKKQIFLKELPFRTSFNLDNLFKGDEIR